jgi:hypothetical protein
MRLSAFISYVRNKKMKHILAVSLLFTIFVVSSCAHKDNSNTLDVRYEACMNNPDCSPEERMELIDEMADYLRYELRRMNKNCMNKNYEDCVSTQSDDFEQWHKINNYMLDIIESME